MHVMHAMHEAGVSVMPSWLLLPPTLGWMDVVWMRDDWWVMAVGAAAAMACAVPGVFLMLRRMSMMGDAISHAVLPGLAVAFLLSGSRGSLVMFIGAAITGVLTAVFTQWVHRLGKVDSGAAMGVVFTVLFAIGLILIRQGARQVDLDPGCVLYGALEFTPYDLWPVMGMMLPRAFVILTSVLLLNLVVILLLFKEFRISTFDPGLSSSMGIPAWAMHYLLMVLVAVTTVAAFESVGSIMVIAMLIAPPAAAHLLTDRLGWLLVLSLVIAAASAVLGQLGAIFGPRLVFSAMLGYENIGSTSVAGPMAVAAGALFALAAVFAPSRGLLARLRNRTQLAGRIAAEDVLGLLFRCEEVTGQRGAALPRRSLLKTIHAGPLSKMLGQRLLRRWGAVLPRTTPTGPGLALTDLGRDRAGNLIRSHRLWEAYLARHLDLPEDHLHAPAEKLEHLTTAEVSAALAADTGRPALDPHGKAIPAPSTSDQEGK